jgi:3-oxochol-4-en-24-oyl-CoA dehydrogenase
MNLELTHEQQLLRDSVAALLSVESSAAKVRAAEILGFDRVLWSHLCAAGVPTMRVPESAGGGGNSLFDAVLVAEQAGRYLASVPLAETIAAARLLAHIKCSKAKVCLDAALAGQVVTLCPASEPARTKMLVAPAGTAAHSIIALDGEVVIALPASACSAMPATLGSVAPAACDPAAAGRRVLATGRNARDLYIIALEEWKLLTASVLVGLAQRALELAAAYSGERFAFGRPIGSYQGIAHPLADSATEVDGARLLIWRAVWACARAKARGAALVSMAYWWATQVSARAAARALHTFGGYGVSSDHDIQLYYRRSKAWALLAGDPEEELLRALDRVATPGDAEPLLPDAGETTLEFEYGPEAEEFALETRAFFEDHLTAQLRARSPHTVTDFDFTFNRQLAAAGRLFPHWPSQYGGSNRNVYDMAATAEAVPSFGPELVAAQITNQVAQVIMLFGADPVRAEVLAEFGKGEAVACMGFTEPSCGSDVFAAKTRGTFAGSLWTIDGQKVFTTAANLARYCLLLVRTDPEAPKHDGLTLFLVPMNLPGIEIQPILTIQNERTNVVFLSGVKVSDRYRIGGVNEGAKVMAATLEMEHGSADFYRHGHMRMLRAALVWAQSAQRNGRPLLRRTSVAARLARALVHGEVSTVLCRRAIWAMAEKIRNRYWGPMAKLFATEFYLIDAMDLMDLAAPDTLFAHGGGTGPIEIGYRQSVATTIYGGTSEVQRSLIAEQALGMPRSRS